MGLLPRFRKEAIGKEASAPPAIQDPQNKACINVFMHAVIQAAHMRPESAWQWH